MQRSDIETELGKINFVYRKGDPLVVFLNGFGSFDTAQSFSKVICPISMAILHQII